MGEGRTEEVIHGCADASRGRTEGTDALPPADHEAEGDPVESEGPEAVLDDQGAGLGMVTVALLELEGLGAERKEGCQGDEGLALARLYPKAEFLGVRERYASFLDQMR